MHYLIRHIKPKNSDYPITHQVVAFHKNRDQLSQTLEKVQEVIAENQQEKLTSIYYSIEEYNRMNLDGRDLNQIYYLQNRD